MKSNYIGKPTSRVDGPLKVTGQAKYAAEFAADGLVYGVVVSGGIAKGSIKNIDVKEALSLKGVLKVFTHENVSGLPWFDKNYKDQDSPSGSPFRSFQNNKIMFSMQPIALVVAETFELARYAASLVKVEYKEDKHETVLMDHLDKAKKAPKGKVGFEEPKSRGNADDAFKAAEFKVEGEYLHSAEHHNPLEMHATTVVWEDGNKLTVYDKTQGVFNCQQYITKVFGLSTDNVRVLSPFVGGAFGSGLRPQYQVFMAVLASLELKRAVRVSLTRQQMFSFGHRPSSVQRLALSASTDGTLQSVKHEAFGETSRFEDYTEIIVNWSGTMYKCENVELKYDLVKLDVFSPMDMRAPGAVTGNHPFESAIDELAYAVKMDPLAFRLRNYVEEDQMGGKPYSSKELKACYTQGAAKFGWDKRSIEPRSMRNGNQLIGWGMGTAAWDAQQMLGNAKAVLSADGKLFVSSGASDIGTGTYTIMTQIAAETLGLAIEDVTFKLGDTNMPEAPLQGGSWTAASVGSAVKAVCEAVKAQVLKLAKKSKKTPVSGESADDLIIDDGYVLLKKDPSSKISISELMKQAEVGSIEEKAMSGPNPINKLKYTFNTHAAVFAEVKVDEELGTVIVSRVVCAVAAGKIINPKTAGSQIKGAVVWGISKALEEESMMDKNLGRFMNHDLSEYHIPVNKDINDIEVIFVEEHDDKVNPLGVKGVGEIGIVAVAGAIANAVFHATGHRVRNLPITMDKVLGLSE